MFRHLAKKGVRSLSVRPVAIHNNFSTSNTSESGSTDTTHFGFQTVAKEDKQKLVAEVFSRVASKYDLMNDVLSVGVHRLWKDTLVNRLNPRHGIKHLDVAGGTGDISFRIIEHLKSTSPNKAFLPFPHVAVAPSQVIVSDINPDMLAVGQERAIKLGYNVVPSPYAPDYDPATSVTPDTAQPAISFQQGDAANLINFPDNNFDSYTIAFGLRNVTEIDNALKEAHRVLKRGGRFMCLEFSKLDNVVAQQFYDQYSFHMMPILGELFANDRASYQYLVESIRKFPPKDELATKMRNAGFKSVSYEGMTFGMVAIHTGYKL